MPSTPVPKFSTIIDPKVIRIPADVKQALDQAKPAGIELWKFTADVITIGLAVIKKVADKKDLADIAQYNMTDRLLEPVDEMLNASKKRAR